jgi:hypothetical protein
MNAKHFSITFKEEIKFRSSKFTYEVFKYKKQNVSGLDV